MFKKANDKKTKIFTKKQLIFRISHFSFLLLASIFTISFVPKVIYVEDEIYSNVVKNSIVEAKDDYALYDFEVYGTKRRFEEAKETQIPLFIEKFKKENRVLMVKLPGENDSLERLKNYILVQDTKVPPLNIEYYVVKNVKYKENSIACETFIPLYKDLTHTVNIAYITLLSITFSLLIVTFVFYDIKNSILLLNKNKIMTEERRTKYEN